VEGYMERYLLLAVASVCGCWEVHRHQGLDMVRQCAMDKIEKAKDNGIGLARLAIALEQHVKSKSWAWEDVLVLKTIFQSYDITFNAIQGGESSSQLPNIPNR